MSDVVVLLVLTVILSGALFTSGVVNHMPLKVNLPIALVMLVIGFAVTFYLY